MLESMEIQFKTTLSENVNIKNFSDIKQQIELKFHKKKTKSAKIAIFKKNIAQKYQFDWSSQWWSSG